MVRETVEGILSAARGENMKILFFTSFADNHTSRNYDRYQDYDTGDFVVYLLPDLKEYDALITFDTYMTGSFIAPIDQLKKDLKPGDKPEASFAVTEPVVAAYEYCNLHGLWMAKA